MSVRTTCLVLLTAMSATACVQTETVPYAYRVPLADNSRGAEAARACADNCAGLYPEDSAAFFACLQTCPDARVVEGAACTAAPEDMPPETYCATRLVKEEKPDQQTAGIVLGAIVKLTELGVAAALSGDGHRGHHEHRHRR